MKKTILFIAACSTLLFTACTSSTEKKEGDTSTTETKEAGAGSTNASAESSLQGEWNCLTMQNYTLILNEGGTGKENSPTGEKEAKWSIKENKLCLQTDGSIELCGDYTVNKDEFTWAAMGMTLKFKKK